MKGHSMRTTLVLALVGLTALVGCRPPVQPEQAPPPAQIVSFSASQPVVDLGDTVTLSWDTKNAATLELRDARKGVVSGVDASTATGTLQVTVTEDTLFVLNAANVRGQMDSASVSVRVNGGADEVVFAASPNRVLAGEPVVLAWVADGAREVAMTTDAGASIDLGGQKEAGSVQVRPQIDTVYTLQVDGKSYQAPVIVRPIIGAFTATPAAGKQGDEITLAWQTSGATRVALTQAGVGEVHTEADPAKVADGTWSFTIPEEANPADILTFDLKVEGGATGSTTSARVEVFVSGAPKIRTWNVPEYARIGGTFEVSWTTLGSDLVEVLKDGHVIYTSPTAADAAAGSLTLPTPQADAKYSLRARDLRGAIALSEERNVNPVGLPTVDTFTATPSSIPGGGDAVTLTWNVPFARSLYILANGDLLVHGAKGVGSGAGTMTVYPNEDTTYELRADNGVGDDVSDTEQVTVGAPASLTWSPTTGPLGMAIELTGTSLGTSGDLVGMPWINVGTGAFVDIGKSGIAVVDDGTGSEAQILELPVAFNGTLFGMPVSATHLNVSVNGWFSFGSTRVEGAPRPTQAGLARDLPPGAIAPFFDALHNFDGSVAVALEDVGNEQRLIVQWTNVWHEDGPWQGTLTFQAQVYSGGRVVFAYDTLLHEGAAAPQVGLVDPFGATALETAHDPAQADVIAFYEPATPPIALTSNELPYTVRLGLTGGYLQFEEPYPFIPPDQFEITEINANPVAGVVNGQWFEVTNHTSIPVDLSGWTIDFGNGGTHTITSAIIPANDRFVFGQSATAGDGVAVDYVYPDTLVLGPGSKLAFTMSGGTYTSLALPRWAIQAGYSWQVGDAAMGLVVAPGVTTLSCAAASSSQYGTNGQHGTPGDPNTPCMTYREQQSIPNNFQPIAGTGTPVTFGNNFEGLQVVTFPTPVNLMRIPFTSLTVSGHGFVSPYALTCPPLECFGRSKEELDPGTEPYGLVAPFWDALYAKAGGGVFWEARDPDGVPGSGDEIVIVSWENMGRAISDPDGDDVVNFQVKFFADGTIEYHYGDILEGHWTNLPFGGLYASSWLEDPLGTSAWVINVHTHFPGIHPFTAYRFTLQ